MDADTLRSELAEAMARTKTLQFDYREVSIPQLINLDALARDA
jgi:hypothetical protein